MGNKNYEFSSEDKVWTIILMGHSDIQTTSEFYLQSTDANEERACQSLDQIMKVSEY